MFYLFFVLLIVPVLLVALTFLPDKIFGLSFPYLNLFI